MTAAAEDATRPTLSFGRKVAFTLLPLVTLVVLTEVAVRLVVPRSMAERLHGSRGFDSAARYLAPDPEVPGGWVTQIFDNNYQETTIAPRDDRRRVLLFGGSNTRGFPQATLEKLLDTETLDAGTDWEVINLGREGYGSRRVLYLFEQAMVLEPDVVVIYSGHNEFVELGFEYELEQALGVLGGLSDALSGLRSFQLFSAAMRKDAAAMPPTNLDRADPSQRELSWDKTLSVYEIYRVNLEMMCDIAAEHDVAVVLCTVVTNMVWLPRVWTPSEPLDSEAKQAQDKLFYTASRNIPERFLSALLPTVRLRDTAWKTGGSERSAESIPLLRDLQGPLARNPLVDQRSTDELRARTMWPDPSRWDAAVPGVLDWFAEVMFAEPTASELKALARAGSALDAAAEAVPDDPRVMFMRGLVSWLTGDRPGAVPLWRRAATLDRSPNNANDRSNGIVREVAALRPGITLLDAEQMFRDRCPDGVVGYEVLMDACHLHPGARHVLMADMREVILELDLR